MSASTQVAATELERGPSERVSRLRERIVQAPREGCVERARHLTESMSAHWVEHPLTRMSEALLGTGFPFKEFDNLETWISSFRTLLPLTSGVRRAGSAALDLAHVASGRLDGFWEIGLKPWDIAAGSLLIEEAGGMVSDFIGGQNFLESGNIVAGAPKIHPEILKQLGPHLPPGLKR